MGTHKKRTSDYCVLHRKSEEDLTAPDWDAVFESTNASFDGFLVNVTRELSVGKAGAKAAGTTPSAMRSLLRTTANRLPEGDGHGEDRGELTSPTSEARFE